MVHSTHKPLVLSYAMIPELFIVLTNNFSGANAQNNSAGSILQASVSGKPVGSMPATNLNIGMDLWNAPSGGSGATKLRPNPSGASSSAASASMIVREGVMPEQWVQVHY